MKSHDLRVIARVSFVEWRPSFVILAAPFVNLPLPFVILTGPLVNWLRAFVVSQAIVRQKDHAARGMDRADYRLFCDWPSCNISKTAGRVTPHFICPVLR